MQEYSKTYKPFKYPWAVELAQEHEKMHWIEQEIDLSEDVKDWQYKLTHEEKNHIIQILRLFTQQDLAVGQFYYEELIPVFKNNEIRNMLGSFACRECFDDQTEVLTNNGWKYFTDISFSDELAQYDIKTKQVSFDCPSDIISKRYKGKMHHYKGRVMDLCVTPSHEILTINPHTKKLKKNKSKKGVWGRNFLCPVSGKTHKDSKTSDTVLLWDRILTMVQADGNIKGNSPWSLKNKPNERRCYLYLCKKRKQDRCRKLLTKVESKFDIRLNEWKKRNGIMFSFRMPVEFDQFTIKEFGWFDLKHISYDRAKVIMDELRYWDSSKNKDGGINSFLYYNNNKKAVDKIMALSTLCGYRTTLKEDVRTNQISPSTGKKFKNQQKAYRLSVVGSLETVYPYREEVDYDGYVYCATMPKGTLIVRRNGRVCISGNCIHQRAYALLNDTLGLSESEYHAFLEYEEMSDKYDWMLDVSTATNQDVALALIRSVFNEGVSLFASFAMLLNYQRSGVCSLTGEDCGDAVMKGMNVVVEWSIADESVHVLGVSRLFREFCNEHPEVVSNYLIGKAWEMAFRIVELEDRFIDLAYELGPIKGLSKDQVKQYMRYITDRRLIQLGIEPGFKVKDNPIPWLDWIISGTDHSNFFEKRVTEYSQAGMEGDWGWNASN